MSRWIDAHCHLTRRFHPTALPLVFDELFAAGCRAIVLGGVDPEDWQQQLEIPTTQVQVIRVFGLHPWTVQERPLEHLQRDFAELQKRLPEAEALGECGLDYFRCKTEVERQKQIEWFEAQLVLAREQKKVCVLHVVRAHHEALRILGPFKGQLRGIVHSFWANPQIAKAWLDLGFHLSIHPRILQGDPHGLLASLPKDRLLFESDSPEILPDGHVTDPRLALDIMHRAALTWQEQPSRVINRQNKILTELFPSLLLGSGSI